MNFLRSIAARIRRFRRIRAAKADSTPLREFVYLDEVSVYSLLASRQGALPTEYTHVQGRSATGALTTSTGITGGVAKAGLSSKSESTVSESTQVLRKSSVQAAFRDFYAGEQDRLALRPFEADEVPPHVSDWISVESRLGASSFDGWLIDAETLSRGELAEIEVELQASQIYRYSSIFSAMEGIIEDSRSFVTAELYAQMRGGLKAVSNVLQQMLIGLIPVKCRAVDYRVVRTNGKSLIVHRRILDQIPSQQLPEYEELYVTGVTEETLFWKDVRRVLFSGSQYRFLFRLNHKGIRSSWIPVKLVDVLSDVAPDLAMQIAQLEHGLGMRTAGQSQSDEGRNRLEAAVVNFGVSLASEYGHLITAEELSGGLPMQVADIGYASGVETRRQMFRAMADFVADRFHFTPDPTTVARLRESAYSGAGLNLDGSIKVVPSPSTLSAVAVDYSGAIIDSEIVAIYW